MTGLPLNPLLAVAQSKAEAAAATLTPMLAAKLDALGDRWLDVKADRDSTGTWNVGAAVDLLRGIYDASTEMADGLFRAAWPPMALMLPPMVRPTVEAQMRAAMRARAAAATAKHFGGWNPERVEAFLADADAYDAETAAQTDALLADIFNEEPTHAAH